MESDYLIKRDLKLEIVQGQLDRGDVQGAKESLALLAAEDRLNSQAHIFNGVWSMVGLVIVGLAVLWFVGGAFGRLWVAGQAHDKE